MALCASCTGAPNGQAQDLPKGFGEAVASVRLGAQSDMRNGAYLSAIIVTMPSGSHTYWKDPGDAGVPPVFAFNGSINVVKAEVLFPAPVRIKEDGLEAIGYTDRVVFPVMVTPADPNKPAALHMEMSYAVCNKICLPGRATGDLALPVRGSADDPVIAAAFAAVPQALAQVEQLRVTPRTGATKPSWTLSWSGQSQIRDVFAQAPQGYSFQTRQDSPGIWTLVADQSGGGAKIEHVPVALTLAGAARSFETVRTFDLPASAP